MPLRDDWRPTGRSAAAPGGSPSILAGALGAALIGAFLFGAWHVLFGGIVKGNWRAGAFGVALAGISAGLLAVEAALVRRRIGGG